MAFALLLSVALQAAPIINLDMRARPLAEVLVEVSKQSGITHRCAPSQAREVILVRTRNESAEEVRKRLAWAMDSDWKREGEDYVLERSDLRTRTLMGEAAERRLRTVTTSFQKLEEHYKPYETAFDRLDAFRKLAGSPNLDARWQNSAPGYWLSRMLLDLGPPVIAAVPDEVDVTYSNLPNPAQKKFPEAISKRIESLEAELEDMARELKDDASATAYFTGFGYKIGEKRPLKYLLNLSWIGSSWSAGLSAFGVDGERQYSVFLSGFNFGGNPYGLADELGKRAPNEIVQLSPLSSEFERVRDPHAEIFAFDQKIPHVKASQPLLDALLNPETNDPLGYWNTEALTAWAGQREICACLPDRLDFATRSCLMPGKLLLGKFKAVAERVGSFKTDVSSDWFMGRPTQPLNSEKLRFNRAALGRFVRTNYEAKKETLDALATYAFEAGRSSVYFGFWTTYARTFNRLGVDKWPVTEPLIHDQLALLGSLGRPVSELESGYSLTYAEATPVQKQLMRNLARYGWYDPVVQGHVSDLELEKSEWLDRDLPAQTVFAVVGVREWAIKRPDNPNSEVVYSERPRTAAEFGESAAHWPSFDLSKYGKVLLGLRSQIRTRFQPNPRFLMEQQLTTGFEPHGEAVPAKDLPPDFLKLAQDTYLKLHNAGGRS